MSQPAKPIEASGNTIVAAPFAMKALVIEDAESSWPPDSSFGQRLFKIRAADREGHRRSANILVSKMYAWRGYQTDMAAGTAVTSPNRITLVAEDQGETIGTISVGFDGPEGLFIDGLFREEIDTLRQQGRRVCEFTKLAIDSVVRSQRVLASLFHVAYIYVHRLGGFDSLLIEVNPRHVRFYEQKLGFRTIGAPKLDPRVNAPAVLMCLDLLHAQQQILLFGGKGRQAIGERSLYPYVFSVKQEADIVGRLRCETH